MKRREFLGLVGGSAVWPLAASAVESVPIVGFLSARSLSESAPLVESFRRGLRQMGLVEGKNVNIVFGWAEGQYSRLPDLAKELVNLPVSVIFAAGGSPAALAAQASTSSVPIVFVMSDPVNLGLVASLSHPGGNTTGISNLASDLPSKSTQLLKQLRPDAKAIAYLVNPANPTASPNTTQASEAASVLGVELRMAHAGTLQEIDDAYADMARLGVVALQVMADAFLDTRLERIIELSAKYRIAGCYPWRDYVVAGGMMSYGTNLTDSYRQAGIYAGRIIKGERPADLPVLQPTKIELVLNLKTAATLGIAVPPQLLAVADEVIE
ncbi:MULTISPECIES: ABC transporter substrate-binding protein [unclassified Bradyrhizobium]